MLVCVGIVVYCCFSYALFVVVVVEIIVISNLLCL